MRTRGVVVELDPTNEQAKALEDACRMRRRVKNHLIRFDRLRVQQALWHGCVEYAEEYDMAPAKVRELWANRETRQELKKTGFSYTVEMIDYYKETTPWVNGRKRRWMLAPPQQARSRACQDYREANSNYVKSWIGLRAGGRVGRPTFESRFAKPRFTVQLDKRCEHICKTYIPVPKIGLVRCMADPTQRLHGGRPTMLTIRKDVDRWYGTIWVTDIPAPQVPHGRNPGSVGVDLNTGFHGIVLSTGKRFPVPPRLEELDQEIRDHQRKHRNKVRPDRRTNQRASKNWLEQKAALGKLYREARRIRNNWLNYVTTWIANHYRVAVLEDLHIVPMTASAQGTLDSPGKNVAAKAALNRRILQAAFGTFCRMLAYKMEQTQGLLVLIDRWFASSQLCCFCGVKNEQMKDLDVRVMTCKACGRVEDRDKNAARNLRRAYEDSIAAEVAGETGGECRPWTGRPLVKGSLLLIKSPGKPINGDADGKKRGRTETGTQCSGGHGRLGGMPS